MKLRRWRRVLPADTPRCLADVEHDVEALLSRLKAEAALMRLDAYGKNTTVGEDG